LVKFPNLLDFRFVTNFTNCTEKKLVY
jgi:hypothetical protein